jgi:hypothetical protein
LSVFLLAFVMFLGIFYIKNLSQLRKLTTLAQSRIMKMRLQKPFSAEAFRKSREVMAGFWLESGINDNLAWDLVCVADEIIANVI